MLLPVLETFLPFRLPCSVLIGGICLVLLYTVLLCFSVSIGGLLLSERKGMSRSGGEGRCRGAGRSERRESYAWDVLYERIINFRLKQRVFPKVYLSKIPEYFKECKTTSLESISFPTFVFLSFSKINYFY